MSYTIEILSSVRNLLGNCRGGGMPADYRDRWLRWWSQADAQLRNLFADGDLAGSLYVTAEKIRDLNLGALPFMVLNREIDAWEARLDQVVADLRALQPFIERPGLIVVPDTSAFLEGGYFTDLDWQALASAGAQPVRLQASGESANLVDAGNAFTAFGRGGRCGILGGISRRRTRRLSFTKRQPCCWRRKDSPSQNGRSSAHRLRPRSAGNQASFSLRHGLNTTLLTLSVLEL